MNQINEKEIQLHIQIVGWLLIAGHALSLVIGGFVFLLLAGIGIAVRDSVASGIMMLVGMFVAAILALLGIPGVIAGIGLLMRWSWARILAIIVAVLGLFNFPIGTLIGIYALFVLLQDAAEGYFGPRNPAVQMTSPLEPLPDLPVRPT